MVTNKEHAHQRRLERDAARAAGWCILRTAGPRTLALATSLVEKAEIEAWTPKRTFRRLVPHTRPNEHGRRPTRDVDAPIIPTFVFARARHLDALAEIECLPATIHPAFSIVRHNGRVPLVADAEVEGLQAEERSEANLLRSIREAESREDADRIRIAALQDEDARRRATNAAERERRRLLAAERYGATGAGTAVVVQGAPAFAGMTGVVESNDGRWAMVLFGGQLSMKIEAWQVVPDPVQGRQS